MSTSDELRQLFGDDFFDRKATAGPTHNWDELCCCGHLRRYHPTSIGGGFELAMPTEKELRGLTWTTVTVAPGCVGALRSRGFESESSHSDHETMVTTLTVHPTCPCREFRGVANVDRPNRYFNQRMPVDPGDPTRHPFVLGLRAFRTHLGRRRAALTDPTWPEKELARRFVWLDGQRVCSIAKCTTTDAVFPIFVDDAEHSELRCPEHR
jgi:hypothetical protein